MSDIFIKIINIYEIKYINSDFFVLNNAFRIGLQHYCGKQQFPLSLPVTFHLYSICIYVYMYVYMYIFLHAYACFFLSQFKCDALCLISSKHLTLRLCCRLFRLKIIMCLLIKQSGVKTLESRLFRGGALSSRGLCVVKKL